MNTIHYPPGYLRTEEGAADPRALDWTGERRSLALTLWRRANPIEFPLLEGCRRPTSPGLDPARVGPGFASASRTSRYSVGGFPRLMDWDHRESEISRDACLPREHRGSPYVQRKILALFY